jgi:HPt (histidine-containing phosphotransfer) domain-containing protein
LDPQRVVTAPSARPSIDAELERPDVPEDLLRRFYSLLTERVLSLEEGIAAKNPASLRDVAHRIAGSGATMGHPELTRIGREVEGVVARGEPWEVVEALARQMLEAVRAAARSRPWMP